VGLELIAVLSALKAGTPLQTRVGVATGLVVVRFACPSRGQLKPLPPLIAKPGAICPSEDAYRQVKSRLPSHRNATTSKVIMIPRLLSR
jgi:hypothetical protein